MMDKKVDYVFWSAVVDGRTGEQTVELVRGSTHYQTVDVQTPQGARIDPKRADPTLTVFYEPMVDDEQDDG